jgi:O-antigen/teichoic acid export membrane protein
MPEGDATLTVEERPRSRPFLALQALLSAERPAFAFVQTVFSQVLITVLNLATGVFLARQLGPEGRGIFAAITFWPLALAMIALAGLPHAQIYRTRSNPEQAGAIFGATLAFGAVLSVVAVSVGLVLLPLLMDRNYTPDTVRVAQWLVLGMTPPVLCAALYKNSFSALSQYRLANQFNQADVMLYLALLLLISAFTLMTPERAALCMFAGTLVVLGWMAWRMARISPLQRIGIGEQARPLASYALRAAPNALLANLALSLDRMVLVYLVPTAEFGLYIVAFGLSRLVLVVQVAVGSVGFPAMAGRDEAATKTMHDRLFRIIFYAMLGVGAGGWVLGGLALRLLYGAEFGSAAGMFHLLLVGAAVTCLCQVPMQLFLCLGRPGFTSAIQAVSFVVSTIAMILMVPTLGATGAAWAVLGGAVVKLVGLLGGVRLMLRLPLPSLLPSAADLSLLRRGVRRA